MSLICRASSRILLIISLVLFSYGAFEGATRVAEARASAGLRVVQTQASFGEVAAGSTAKVTYTILNPSTQPVRIMGARLCGPLGCVVYEPNCLPFTIPPEGRYELPVTVLASRPGDFNMSFPIYTTSPGSPEIALTITGRILDSSTTRERIPPVPLVEGGRL